MSNAPSHCPSCFARVADPAASRCPTCSAPFDAGTESEPVRQVAAAPVQAVLPGLDQTPLALPIVLAAAGAALGALLWAGVAYATGLEIGYVAWILGGLVGGGCVLAGGRGPVHAMAAAVLTLAGIAGGKVYGTHLLIGSQLEQLGGVLDRATYDEIRRDAQAYAQLPAAPSVEQVRTFMIDRDYAEGAVPEDLPDDEVGMFMEYQTPVFTAMSDPSYNYERWRDDQMQSIIGQIPLLQVVIESLSAIDILFVLLGLSTAFGMVSKASAAQPSA